MKALNQQKNYIGTLFVDLDGPILDISNRYYKVYSEIIGEVCGSPINKDLYWQLKRSNVSLVEILKKSGSIKNVKTFRREWLKIIEKRGFLLLDKKWPFTNKTLSLLRSKYKIILVTLRKSKSNLYWQLGKLGLREYIHAVLCGNNDKSGWQVKSKIIKSSKQLSKNSWIIGDSEVDILTGRKLGLKTIAVLSGIRNRKFLMKYKPDYIVNSINGVLPIIKKYESAKI